MELSLWMEIFKSLMKNEKNYRILTFSFKKLINTYNVHKVLQEEKLYEQYPLFDIYVAANIPIAQETIFIVTKNHTCFN